MVAGLIRALPQWQVDRRARSRSTATASAHPKASRAIARRPSPRAGSSVRADRGREPTDTDTGRFLAAGAERSFWLRTAQGQLAGAVPVVRKMIAACGNVIVESNSILEFVQPDLFLMVLDFSCEDFKPSSLRFLDRADAFIVIDRGINAPLWEEVSRGLWDSKQQFLVKPPYYVTMDIAEFVRTRLSSSAGSVASKPGSESRNA